MPAPNQTRRPPAGPVVTRRGDLGPSPSASGERPAPRARPGFWGPTRILVLVAAAFAGGYAAHAVRGPGAGPDSGAGDAVASASASVAAEVWTCSMHPQIRQPKFGLCPLCAMDLIPASGGGEDETAGLRELSISREARELLRIEVAPVERRAVEATVRMVGKVDYDETRLGTITARIPGRLDRLYADATGIEVREGDPLVSLYSPELYSAQAELIRAREAAVDRRATAAAPGADRLLESAREKLRLWGLTEPQVEEIERRGGPAEHLTIPAPMSGVVIAKELQEGDYVETGTRIYTIADLGHVWVRLDAYESDLAWLRLGQRVEFVAEAYPGEVFAGRVAFIDPVLNPRTRTVKVRVDVPNPEGRLKPEMFVTGVVRARLSAEGRVIVPELADSWLCRMHPGVVERGPGTCGRCGMPLAPAADLGAASAGEPAPAEEPMVVPASAVLQTGTRAVVYLERPEADRPTYEGREVVLGPRAGDVYLVRGGLDEGDRVVINGAFKLDSALQLLARPSMMSPEAGLDPGPDAPDRLLLPLAVSDRMSRVAAAAREVERAAAGDDRDALLRALRALEEAIAAVDASGPEGRAARVWKELAMRLRNGAVESRWAAGDARLRAALGELLADVDRLRDRFALPEGPGATLAGAPFDAPAAFRSQLGRLWRSYVEAQEALADDAPAAARRAAVEGRATLASIDEALLEGGARDAWTTVLAPELEAALDRMERADDLDGLRAAFEAWSIAMTPALTSFGIDDGAGPVFRLYCSMAFDFRGAAWLQAAEEVRNPYFGASMLKCANTVERLALAGGPAAGGRDHE